MALSPGLRVRAAFRLRTVFNPTVLLSDNG